MLNELERLCLTEKRCEQCGACCKAFAIPLCPADLEREPKLKEWAVPADKLPKDVGEILVAKWDEQYAMAPKKGLPCPFLIEAEDGKYSCSIYLTRPTTCRRFVTTPYTCHAARLELAGVNIRATIKNWRRQNIPRRIIIAATMQLKVEDNDQSISFPKSQT